MNCKDTAELIEPLAAGEIERTGELGAHLDACPHCAAALTLARQVNEWLAGDIPQAPRHFTASVLQQLPSRAPAVETGEADLDDWFDTVAIVSLVPILLGIWLLIDPAFLERGIGLLSGLGNLLAAYVAVSAAVVIAYVGWELVDDI